jgi:hypothetical protein
VTAEEWEACRDPGRMTEALQGKASRRKFHLFACGCCARVRHLFRDARCRDALAVAERLADAHADPYEVGRAALAVHEACVERHTEFNTDPNYPPGYLAEVHFAPYLALIDPPAVRVTADWGVASTWEFDYQAVCHLIRDVFGNPFRPPVTFPPAVLARNDGAAVKLATVILDGRDPATGELDAGRLAILADALEEAGVDDRAALEHLRGPGPHYHGCHVVDAVLNRS